ncbi:uncharacterized protein M6B38_183245 [Iris pallida]|uniref:Uncharacterized protein n=1 Tax=Iris pallida TaxID=29817 RepID=A0AAX6EKG7_IRIPA|nr:uncharacterized protein M6B38_183245 [Iris pallida]
MQSMASVTLSMTLIKRDLIIKGQFRAPGLKKVPCFPHRSTSINNRHKVLPLRCTKMFPWEASPPYSPLDEDSSIIKGSDLVDPIHAEDSPEMSSVQNEEDIIEMHKEQTFQPQLNWPMWVLGPSVLLATGMVPTLWLPLSSVFLGPNIAGLLSLVGLDCIFNIGASLFLLMADSCARPRGVSSPPPPPRTQVPLAYRLWNMGASLLGFLVPLLMLLASHRGSLQPHLPFLSFAVLLGPYLLLLSIQVLTEVLTWHWESPVWLLTPLVYETYRVLQLMRGLRLGVEIGAPGWAVESIRGLVSWWVLVLGIQLMRVAWFVGLDPRMKHQS